MLIYGSDGVDGRSWETKGVPIDRATVLEYRAEVIPAMKGFAVEEYGPL